MTRRKERKSKRPVPNPKPKYASDYWDLYRKAQVRRRAGRLPNRIQEILNLERLGYDVKRIDVDNTGNQEAVFHVFGNNNQGITLAACHRSYQVHATLKSGSYNPRPPEYTLRKLGIYPKGKKNVEKGSKHVEKDDKIGESDEKPGGFKPARSFWSWRKHFGPQSGNVEDRRRGDNPSESANRPAPHQHQPASVLGDRERATGGRTDSADSFRVAAPAIGVRKRAI